MRITLFYCNNNVKFHCHPVSLNPKIYAIGQKLILIPKVFKFFWFSVFIALLKQDMREYLEIDFLRDQQDEKCTIVKCEG